MTSSWEVRQGDCLALMRAMEAGSVDAIVTSPPYADQRDYAKAAAGIVGQNGPAARHTHPRTRNASRAARADAPTRFVHAHRTLRDELAEDRSAVYDSEGSALHAARQDARAAS